MRRSTPFLLILLLLNVYTYGQLKECECICPKRHFSEAREPDTVFYFSNGRAIGLCGYREIDSASNKISFYEFNLFVCGQNSIIASGGWFLQNSKLEKIRDTLILKDCPFLPTGKNFKEEETPWIIEKIYFIHGKAKITKRINRNIRKYNRQEIQKVFAEYERIKPSHSNFDDSTIELVYKLFVATISGNIKARKYFFDVPQKFSGLDAIYGEMYSDLKHKLSQWDKK
jgi:hypothetical protein